MYVLLLDVREVSVRFVVGRARGKWCKGLQKKKFILIIVISVLGGCDIVCYMHVF